MNTRDEIIDAMNGQCKELPPPAIFTQTATTSQMDACGIAWPEANTDSKAMAELSLQASRRFGFALARVPYCLTVEAEGFGCVVDLGSHERQAMVTDSPFRSVDIPEVPGMPDPEEFIATGRRKTVLEACEIIGKTNGDLFIISSCDAPMVVASHILGAENYLMATLTDPDAVVRWQEAITPCIEAYAAALSEVSDCVTIVTEGSTDFIHPDMFDILTAPSTSAIVNSVDDAFSVIHCCGDTTPVVGKLASLGADGLSVETDRDPEGILEETKGKTRLLGGINPISGLMMGSPRDIIDAAKRYADLGYDMIAPECGVPPQTSDENMLALSHYREY